MDMDGTVTDSRQTIKQEMVVIFKALRELGNDITIIRGATKEQILKQIGDINVNIMAQSGNETSFWKNRLNTRDKVEIFRHTNKVKETYPELFLNRNQLDLLQDRGSQMSFSLVGHNADIEIKKAFDPNGDIRNKILKAIPFFSNNLEVRIGGTTCFDYTNKNGNKGKNIDRLIKMKGWNKDECIYFGDALFKGGNDESVIGIIDTVQVGNPDELILKLRSYKDKGRLSTKEVANGDEKGSTEAV